MARSGFFSVDSLKGVHVLVVDDERVAREVLRDVLEYCGALVLSVGSAREAFDSLRLIKPDLVVTKLTLPEHDGFWLLRQLRSLKPEAGGEVPAIAISGSDDDQEESLTAGFHAHFTWPLNPWELTRTIASLVEPA
jgi:CheY-like chemotaxis protein